jgi:hypothetical protein
VILERIHKIIKILTKYTAHVERGGEGDTDNYFCNWKLITIILKAFGGHA